MGLQILGTALAVMGLAAGVGAESAERDASLASYPSTSSSFLRGSWIDSARRHEYRPFIRETASYHRMDPEFVEALIAVESNFNPRAISRQGAQGLMQLMPKTSKHYRVSDPYDPYQNIKAGVRHLRVLLDRYQGNLELTLAAYNAGETAVEKYGGIPPYSETQGYVSKILNLYYQGNKSPSQRMFRYEREDGRVCIGNAVPAGARNISPVVFTKRGNF
jgi:soluble lytic murein transglycosylase-like protein